MKVKRLKDILATMDDETEIFIRNSANPVGNIEELAQVEETTVGYFGQKLPCIVLNTMSSKGIRPDDNVHIADFLPTVPQRQLHEHITGETGVGKASFGKIPDTNEL